MTDRAPLEDFKNIIEQQYPNPIASVFRKCRLFPKYDLGGRHKSLIDLFDAFVRLTCIVQLQSARKTIKEFKNKLPNKEKDLEFLKRPSLGGWINLMRGLSSLRNEASASEWVSRIGNWYNTGKNDENRKMLDLLNNIQGISFQTKTKTPNAEVCNALVNYRNKHLAHGAHLTNDKLKMQLPILEEILATLLYLADFLSEMELFFTDRIEDAGGDKWKLNITQLKGHLVEPRELYSKPKIEKSELYCTDSLEKGIETSPLPLGPFLLWRYNEERKLNESYFYNDAWRTKLEYISFETGMYYYHKELKEGFKELISLDLSPVAEEKYETIGSLSQKELEFKADELVKRASFEQQKGHLEDALQILELSIEYVRDPDTFLNIAKIQQELGDSADIVKHTLLLCLQEDPQNVEASNMLKSLESEGKVSSESAALNDEKIDPNNYPTSFDLISPLGLSKKGGWIFCIGFGCGWILISCLIEFTQGRVHDMLGLIFGAIVAATFVIGTIFGRNKLIRMRLPLSMQLNSMRLDRFNTWFHEQLKNIFGHIVINSNGINVFDSIRKEKVYFTGWLIQLLVFAVSAFVLSQSYELPSLMMVKRSIDFLTIYILCFPAIRYVVMSTVFIYKYSQLSLKPMLTLINDYGMRSLGSLMTYNLGLVVFFYVSYWSGAAFLASLDLKFDFLLLGICTIIYMVWSVGMPLTIRRVAIESRANAVQEYSRHIENAFNAFIEEPNEDYLKRYSWLKENEKVINNIPTWPLSWKETLFGVVGSNLLLIGVDIWYICHRLEIWPSVIDGMTGIV